MAIVNVKMDGQEFNRRDVQAPQMLDSRLRPECDERASVLFRYLRHQVRESFYVHFVDQRSMPRSLGRPIVAPRKCGIHDGAERCVRRVVAIIERLVSVGIAQFVAEQRVVPFQIASNRPGIGVKQNFVRIESMSIAGRVRSVNAITVELIGINLWQIRVPDLVRPFAKRDSQALML